MPRYEVRFANGVYHVFDTFTYRPIRARGLLKQAAEDVAHFNSRPVRSKQ